LSFDNKNIALVSNPTSAQAIAVAEEIELLLLGIDINHTLFTKEWPSVFNGYTEVWIVGGDGTLNYFINKYPGLSLPLTIFKGGTGNDFHWILYGTITIEQQVEKILSGYTKPVDAGKCNDRYFLNNLGIGFEAKITKSLLGKSKKPGKTSYYLSVLKNIFFFKEFKCTVSSNNRAYTDKHFMISVCNGKRIGGGFHVAPHAVVDDQLLDVNIIRKIHPLKRIKYLPVIEKGLHTDLPFIDHFTTKEIRITSDNLLDAHIDGEYFAAKDFHVECLPKRFSFLC
jgi:YegS/Rv2252/BmrU family lipid kinase